MAEPAQSKTGGEVGMEGTANPAPKDYVTEMSQNRLEHLRREYEDKVDKLQKEHSTALKEKDSENNETIRELKDTHVEELAARDEEKKSLVEEKYGLNAEVDDERLKVKNREADLTEQKEQKEQNEKMIELLKSEISDKAEDSNEQINAIKEHFQARLDDMEKMNGISVEGERDELAERTAKLTDEVNSLQEQVRNLRRKLEKKEQKLENEKQERLRCLAEQKMEKDTEIQRIQDRCDQQVQTVRERDEMVKEALKKDLQRENDENRIKLEKELEDLKKLLEEERSKHELSLQREIACRDEQRSEFDGFKKLFEEEKSKEIQLLKECHKRDMKSLDVKCDTHLRQKDEEIRCMAADFEVIQNSLKEQMTTIENEKLELQDLLKRKVQENSDYINKLVVKHVDSENDLRKEKRELETKIDVLKSQLRS